MDGEKDGVKQILSELADIEGVQAVVVLDAQGFPVEAVYRTEVDEHELACIARDTLLANIKLAFTFRRSAFIQGAMETSKSLMVLTHFPKNIYMVTIADRNVGTQRLWNEVSERYRRLVETLGK